VVGGAQVITCSVGRRFPALSSVVVGVFRRFPALWLAFSGVFWRFPRLFFLVVAPTHHSFNSIHYHARTTTATTAIQPYSLPVLCCCYHCIEVAEFVLGGLIGLVVRCVARTILWPDNTIQYTSDLPHEQHIPTPCSAYCCSRENNGI
jgi:hypothetical protein